MKTIRLALRSILHFRTYSAVNIAGLTLSLLCVVIIFRYVYGELTVDRFIPDLDRVYVSYVEATDSNMGPEFAEICNPNEDKEFIDLRRDPAVEYFANALRSDSEEVGVGDRQFRTTMVAADSNLLKIIDIPVIAGVVDLSDPTSAALTAGAARRFFGNDDPLGRQVRLGSGQMVTITGILGEPSTRSSLDFELLVSYYLTEHWSMTGISYVKLHPHQDAEEFNRKYSDFFYSSMFSGRSIRYQLFPLKDAYLRSGSMASPKLATGNRTNVNLLLSVGLLILTIGIVNFINIYLAVIMRRGRELGMKKVFGASGERVLVELYAENFVLVGLSLVLALALVELFSPVVRNLLGLQQIPFAGFDFALAGGLLVVIPLLTTIFPYLRYRYSTPVTELQGIGRTNGRGVMRRIFLFVQYALTIFMIILSLFFNKQLHTMLHTDPGFRTEGVLHTPPMHSLSSDPTIHITMEEFDAQLKREAEYQQTIRQRLDASPLLTKWAYGEVPVDAYNHSEIPFSFEGGEFKDVSVLWTDSKWMDLFDIELLDGRMFDESLDQWGDYRMIVSEELLPYFGITDWRTAQLQPNSRLWWSMARQDEMKTNPPYTIVGVVKSYRNTHIGHAVLPTIFLFSDTSADADLFVIPAPGRTDDALDFLRRLREDTFGGEFSYTWVEDEVAALYAEDVKVATIYTIFTVIAIFISMLGLFSMSLYDVQQRYNEIAVRKVNGASTAQIVGLLLRRYVILLAAAFVLAAPLAWLAVWRYLEDFALRTTLSWWIFAVSLLLTAAISLLTLIAQTRRAAAMNPADAIRNE